MKTLYRVLIAAVVVFGSASGQGLGNAPALMDTARVAFSAGELDRAKSLYGQARDSLMVALTRSLTFQEVAAALYFVAECDLFVGLFQNDVHALDSAISHFRQAKNQFISLDDVGGIRYVRCAFMPGVAYFKKADKKQICMSLPRSAFRNSSMTPLLKKVQRKMLHSSKKQNFTKVIRSFNNP